MLADEPTGCLDSDTGRGVMEVFERLQADGQTLFMVTHDAAIAGYADRILRMRDGRLAEADAAAPAGERAVTPV